MVLCHGVRGKKAAITAGIRILEVMPVRKFGEVCCRRATSAVKGTETWLSEPSVSASQFELNPLRIRSYLLTWLRQLFFLFNLLVAFWFWVIRIFFWHLASLFRKRSLS